MSTDGADRRSAILDAAIDLLATKGLPGVTHRSVDEAAGLPEGSCSYYFGKKTALLIAAAERLGDRIEQSCAEARRHFADLVAEGKLKEATAFMAQDLVDDADDGKILLLARFELSFAGLRTPELKPAADRLESAARAPVAFVMKLLTKTAREEDVDACMGVIDGLALRYATGQAPRPTVRQISRLLRSIPGEKG